MFSDATRGLAVGGGWRFHGLAQGNRHGWEKERVPGHEFQQVRCPVLSSKLSCAVDFHLGRRCSSNREKSPCRGLGEGAGGMDGPEELSLDAKT